MHLIVGLGNPGERYDRTRHNSGFRAVRAFHHLNIESFSDWKERFDGLISEGKLAGEKVVLLLPQTYMNRSGEAVLRAVNFWGVPASHVTVVYDDFTLDLGTMRIRRGGTSGGHNGIASVTDSLQTQDVPRLRIGIGSPRMEGMPSEAFVLGKTDDEERQILEEVFRTAADALMTIVREGHEAAMERFNG